MKEKYHHLHFIDREAEHRKGEMTHLRPALRPTAEQKTESRAPEWQASHPCIRTHKRLAEYTQPKLQQKFQENFSFVPRQSAELSPGHSKQELISFFLLRKQWKKCWCLQCSCIMSAVAMVISATIFFFHMMPPFFPESRCWKFRCTLHMRKYSNSIFCLCQGKVKVKLHDRLPCCWLWILSFPWQRLSWKSLF